jgi:hypothetical protein
VGVGFQKDYQWLSLFYGLYWPEAEAILQKLIAYN